MSVNIYIYTYIYTYVYYIKLIIVSLFSFICLFMFFRLLQTTLLFFCKGLPFLKLPMEP